MLSGREVVWQRVQDVPDQPHLQLELLGWLELQRGDLAGDQRRVPLHPRRLAARGPRSHAHTCRLGSGGARQKTK